MVLNGIIVLLGDFSRERVNLESIGQEFGWQVRQLADPSAMDLAIWKPAVAVVVIHPTVAGLQPQRVLAQVHIIAPTAKSILCARAAELRAYDERIADGAFTVVRFPLSHAEVRHAIGFAWGSIQAEQRAQPLPHARVRPH